MKKTLIDPEFKVLFEIVSLNREVREREQGLSRESLSLRAELSRNYNNFFVVGVSSARM